MFSEILCDIVKGVAIGVAMEVVKDILDKEE